MSLTTDSTGTVHVAWSEETGDGSSFITYASLSNGTWSIPNEILTSGSRQQAVFPSITCDSRGYLHLVWLSDSITYSQAYAPFAQVAQSWAQPVLLEYAQNYLGKPQIISDGRDILYVVYSIGIEGNSGIYYVKSVDRGLHWSDPLTIYKNMRSDRMVNEATMALDPEGRLHVVWVESDFPETYPAIGIRYARSEDGGETWSDPESIADGPYHNPDVAVRGEREVHVVWSGTTNDRYKFHRWSPNYGATWSGLYRNEELGGLQGVPALAVDGNLGLHWLMIGEVFSIGNSSLVHTEWLESGWSPVEVLLRSLPIGQNPGSVAATVALGNILHVATAYPLPSETEPEGWQFEIYYLQGSLAAAAIAAQPLPSPQATTTLEQSANVSPSVSPTGKPELNFNREPLGSSSPSDIVTLSVGVSVAVIFLAVLVAYRRRS